MKYLKHYALPSLATALSTGRDTHGGGITFLQFQLAMFLAK